ncbi:MAG: type VI secretion system tip protein TssI/VgrG [Polyangiaceae bacterium]
MTTSEPIIARFESADFDTNALQVARVSGREAIGELFYFDVDLVAHDRDRLEQGDVLGARVRLSFERGRDELRVVHGIVWSMQEEFDFAAGAHRYRVRVMPRAARMLLIESQDIFIDMSVPEIVLEKLRSVEIGDQDVDTHALLGTYPKRDHVTQFEETDLAFMSRWFEHLGVSFFFDHTTGVDRIVVTDNAVGFGAYEHQPVLELSAHEGRPEQVRTLRLESEVIPELYFVMDYDYRNPDLELTCRHTSELGMAGGVVEYGGHFRDLAAGEHLARVRAEERECTARVFHGTSDIVRLSAGFRYDLDGHPELDKKSLVVTWVEHELTQPASGVAESGGYKNSFAAIPGESMFRPRRRTPRPRIGGLMTGVVEPREFGKTEDPACVDDQGRYWVKFIFDTAPLGSRKASKPVRMALPSAGPRSGFHFPLRPGIEVALGFLNGDPDRPIIVGALHNGKVAAHVVAENQQVNSIETTSGIRMHFKDTLQRR